MFDFVKDAVFVIDEPPIIEQTLSNYYENLQNHFEEITEAGEIGLAPDEIFLSGADLREKLSDKQRLELRALGKTAAETGENLEFENDKSEIQISNFKLKNSSKPLFLFPTVEIKTEFEIGSRSTRKFHGNLKDFSNNLKSHAETQRTQSLIAVNSHGIAERLTEILRDYEIESRITNEFKSHIANRKSQIIVGDLSGGFEIPSLDLIVYTETDIFGETTQLEYQKPKTKDQRPKTKLGAFISDFRDLKPGDFVVHIDHGIGKFEGLQTIAAQGIEREFMLLIYAENAKLFVPVERSGSGFALRFGRRRTADD